MDEYIQKNIHTYNITFEKVMNEIDLTDFIKSYKYTRVQELAFKKQFEKFSKYIENKKDEHIAIIYEECCQELNKLEVLYMMVEDTISGLRVISNETRVPHDILYKLSKIFKRKLTKYTDAFYKFKDLFMILQKVVKHKSIDNQKTK